MQTLNKGIDSVVLDVLKKCRERMVKDFLDLNPEIYKGCYESEYKNSPVLLKLSMENYFLSWLGNHWEVFSDICISLPEHERAIAEKKFASAFLELLKMHAIVNSTNPLQLHLGIDIIKGMQKTLTQLIQAGENADAIRNKIALSLEKNRVLFDRKIKQLNKEKL